MRFLLGLLRHLPLEPPHPIIHSALMKKSLYLSSLALPLVCTLLLTGAEQNPASTPSQLSLTPTAVCVRCIRAHMNFLASDALRGRGSGTGDELVAATYIASQFEQYGIEPAGDSGGYIQRATVIRYRVAAPPRLTFHSPGAPSPSTTWIHGKEFLALKLGEADVSGPLEKFDPGRSPSVRPGAFVFVKTSGGQNREQLAFQLVSEGARAVIVSEAKGIGRQLALEMPSLPFQVEGGPAGGTGPRMTVLAVTRNGANQLASLPDGTMLRLHTRTGRPVETHTWNVVGKITGTYPGEHDDIVLSAHLDHLGIGVPVNGDNIYNGADDDASGTTAVLELARVLSALPKPRRTVLLTLFGSEEKGGLGSLYFRGHPPVPLKDIAAYLEFEMIGRPDPAVPHDTVWLTGWNRTNLGPELAKHGAHLVADPHPAEDFFRRSDNYVFARQGMIAQTISSYGLHRDYHQPSDDLSHIDFPHMNEVIESLLGPVIWLVNSDFVPHWSEGGKP